MSHGANEEPSGPDLTAGVPLDRLQPDGHLLGHVGDEDVLVAKVNDEIFAVGARCTHYRGPLADGLIVGDTVRCPWHHSCFSLRTGEAVRPPALDPIACWRVRGRRRSTRGEGEDRRRRSRVRDSRETTHESIVIVGGGAAGLAAADMLRREGYGGDLTMISADADPPYDRPNLSKDYLAGTAPEDWMPLRDEDYFASQNIQLQARRLACRPSTRRVAPSRSTMGARSSMARCCSRPARRRSPSK